MIHEIIKAIIMGIVQGLSEFLPISSSGHLVFTKHIIGIVTEQEVNFAQTSYDIVLDMMLHVGTLIAVIIFFWKDIVEIWDALCLGIKTKKFESYNSKLSLYIIFGTLISAVVGLILSDTAETLMERPAVVGFLLIITGFVLYFSEKKLEANNDKKEEINKRTAILMSIAQGIAALPGFSRSGLTIATGLFSGANRMAAARYSFLLSAPIILGASIVYPLKEISVKELITYPWLAIGVGTVVSAIVGYICIKYFLKFISKYSLKAFAYYCFIVGFITNIFFTFR